VVRVPKAAGAVIDPGIRKSDPAIARQIALPIAAPNGLPRGLLPVLQTGVANAPLIAQQSGLRIAEAIALLTVALTGTQTVLKNATWSAQTIAIVEWIEGRIVLRSVVPMVGIDP